MLKKSMKLKPTGMKMSLQTGNHIWIQTVKVEAKEVREAKAETVTVIMMMMMTPKNDYSKKLQKKMELFQLVI